jgi:predicted transcriptional regulator
VDSREVALRQTAERVLDGEKARLELRQLMMDLVDSDAMSMMDMARITGIPRTTLYYLVWGRAGKTPVDDMHGS